ncbi:MAG: hypothetical protein Q4G19_08065, partial [Clostridia bacterium]|nr:hypothetical protein [Clostridia bacterium]
MKRSIVVLFLLAILFLLGNACADDYSEYVLKTDYYYLSFPSSDSAQNGQLFLNAHSAAEQSERTSGHLLWIRDGEIYRDFRYDEHRVHPWKLAKFMQGGDECYILLPTGARDQDDREPAAEVYRWNDAGMELAARIPGQWENIYLRVFKDGFCTWDHTTGSLTTYRSNGTLLASYQLEPNENRRWGFIYGEADGMQLFSVNESSMGDAHPIYCIYALKNGQILWTKECRFNPSISVPGDGYCYIACKLEEDNSYSPFSIEKVDSLGNTVAKRKLSADKLVISFSMDIDPQTGNTVLYGKAVANSRKVYKAFVMELDENMNEISVDVRTFDHYNDYDFTIYPLQEGGCVLFSRGRDNEGDDRIADPV